MKILMVAIPNHHFFQWVNQLEGSGYEVYWFDITDGITTVERIKWVTQIKGWKLKYDYPLRHTLKSKFPTIYKYIQRYNEKSVTTVFKELLLDLKPDIVHCFEMQLAGLPILQAMNQHIKVPFMYSSWGSDMFFYRELGVEPTQVAQFLSRVNFLITDCKRDGEIAKQNGFKNTFLGVYMGNGGLDIDMESIDSVEDRAVLIIKGYENNTGKALKILEAIELLPKEYFQDIEIIIYSADLVVKEHVEKSTYFTSLQVQVHCRGGFIANSDLLKIMGKSIMHIANSVSDGLPTSAVEAMGMGAFPIQSNPGNSSEDVIEDGVNGFLINNPMDSEGIAFLIEKAINNVALRRRAQEYNINFVQAKYNRAVLKKEIVQMYQKVLLNE